MDGNNQAPPFKLSRLGWVWLASLFALFAVGWIVGWFDHSTQLTPSHVGTLEFSFAAAAATAIVSAGVLFRQSEGALYRRLIISLIVAPLISILGVFILLSEALTLVVQSRDFPPATTRTFSGILIVDRAYQTDGKGRSWNIQTTPIWSNLDITEADYDFMLAHRSPDDFGRDPDEITSDGYFCAKVVLQQSDSAIRILNAGTHKLPKGTVGICSELLAKSPTIPIIR